MRDREGSERAGKVLSSGLQFRGEKVNGNKCKEKSE